MPYIEALIKNSARKMAFLFIFQLLTNKISDNNIVKRETYNSMQGGILTNVGI